MAEVLLTKRSQPGRSWGVLHSALWICQSYLSAWIIWKKYVELVWHTKSMHPQLRKIYAPLSCLSLVVFWPPSINWYSRVVVHWCYRCLLFMWSVKPFHSGMTRRNKLQYLIHIQDWVKVVVFCRSKWQSSFWFVQPLSITLFMSGIS